MGSWDVYLDICALNQRGDRGGDWHREARQLRGQRLSALFECLSVVGELAYTLVVKLGAWFRHAAEPIVAFIDKARILRILAQGKSG